MRRALLVIAVGALSACPPPTGTKHPPPGQFYFPTGLPHVDSLFNTDGVLYVANANFDRRYDTGSVSAVNLNRIGLPPFGALPSDKGPLTITELFLSDAGTETSTVQIASFAGEMGVLPMPDGVRLFIPTRSEGNRVYAIDAPRPSPSGPTLKCVSTDGGPAEASQDCTASGMSLTAFEKVSEAGIPRAPAPIGVGVSAKREVFITSLQQADTPPRTTMNFQAYVVRLNGDLPEVTPANFIPMGQGATSSIAVGARYAYATGRVFAQSTPSYLVRVIDTDVDLRSGMRAFSSFNANLENTFSVFEGRGVVTSSDESRLYVAGRAPDTLVVVSIIGKTEPVPLLRVEHTIPLPEGPTQVTVIPRPGRSDLVAITCSTAGVVAFYDDDVGDLVSQVSGVGQQPFGIAVDSRPAADGVGEGARLYVSNFTDGRITVIDVPHLSTPREARIVAFLGPAQLCLTRGSREAACVGGGP